MKLRIQYNFTFWAFFDLIDFTKARFYGLKQLNRDIIQFLPLGGQQPFIAFSVKDFEA